MVIPVRARVHELKRRPADARGWRGDTTPPRPTTPGPAARGETSSGGTLLSRS